ncbi:MAG TPA: hypothetical protein VHO25_10350 [Polyangiaceae bacterium]|nr:hypothetical protein [Polyangiaceae bacterium]
MLTIMIRPATRIDAETWIALRGALWPDLETLKNTASIAIHKHLGFRETARIVTFVKPHK